MRRWPREVNYAFIHTLDTMRLFACRPLLRQITPRVYTKSAMLTAETPAAIRHRVASLATPRLRARYELRVLRGVAPRSQKRSFGTALKSN